MAALTVATTVHITYYTPTTLRKEKYRTANIDWKRHLEQSYREIEKYVVELNRFQKRIYNLVNYLKWGSLRN